MNIVIYGNGQDTSVLAELIGGCGPMQYRKIRFSKPESYDEY